MKNWYMILFVLSLVTVGCKEQGPFERAGDRADEIVDNAKEGEPLLKKKGPLEKVGEAVDEATH